MSGPPAGVPLSGVAGALHIAARRLDALFGLVPASHLSLVLRREDGEEVEYEAAPELPGPFAYGRIVLARRPYRPRPDRRSIRVPLPSDVAPRQAALVLDAEVARLNTRAVAYEPLGPNSNTVVRTLLLRLGLEPLQPAAVAPGFEYDAL